MRLPLLLSALVATSALAGCTQGDPGDDAFVGSCPSWVKGLSTNIFQEGFQNTSVPERKVDPSHPTGAGLHEFQGHPLDLVDLDFHPARSGSVQAIGVANGTLELRVFRSDGEGGIVEQLLLHDTATGPDGPHLDHWSFGPGIHKNFTLQVVLASPHDEPDTRPIVIQWDFLPDTDTRTPSEAVMLYTAYVWYRTCSSDGTRL